MDFLLPVLALAAPVLVVVLLAVRFGRRLSSSCGGVSPDGSCPRCGKPAVEVEKLRARGETPCP